MIMLVLFVMAMFLWLISQLPQARESFAWAGGWLAFFAVLFLGLYTFVPALR